MREESDSRRTSTSYPMTDVSSVTSAQQSAVRQQIDVAVLKKQHDATKAAGAAAVQLLQAAAALSKSTSTGVTFDAVG